MLRPRSCVRVLGMALGILLTLTAPPAHAQAPTARAPVSFINDVAPIFKENCFACHDSKKRKGKLDMSTYAGLRKGGTNDDPIVAGKPDESELIQLIAARGTKRMPPKEGGEPLPREKVAVIEQWIREGARLDAGLEPTSDLMRELRHRWQPPAPPATYERPIMVTALAFTPDNQQLVIGGQHELTVWDVESGKLRKRVYTRGAGLWHGLPAGRQTGGGGRPAGPGRRRAESTTSRAAPRRRRTAWPSGTASMTGASW